MEKQYYRQCRLQQGALITVSWIPEKFARAGRMLRLKDQDGAWDNGWKVIGVWGRENGRVVEMMKSAHRTTRRVSDI